jgi:glycosyltransferase involved in cell wall biosynthesis
LAGAGQTGWPDGMSTVLAEARSSAAGVVEPPLAGKRVAAIVYSSYWNPRPRMMAEAFSEEGASVEVICLKETDAEPRHESLNSVDITRVPFKHRRGGKLSYLLRYGSFVLLCGAILARRAWKRHYDLVHVHNMPDILVFSALVPKILGAKVILDLHDPMPELMVTIFGLREDSYWVRVLKKLEKWSLRFADAGLTVNDACSKIFSARSCPPEKISVVMNSPDETIFQNREPSRQPLAPRGTSRPFVIMYHGSLVERHGLDLAVMALGKVRESIPSAELRVYGRSTPFLEHVMNSVRELELSEGVRYLGLKNLKQIAEAIDDCDVGIISNRRSIFTQLNTPTRIFEFLWQSKPVIAPYTPGILDYFGPQELVFFELGNADDLAAKIEYVFKHPEEMEGIVGRGQKVCRAHKWSSERRRLVRLTTKLLKVTGSTVETEEKQE